MYGKTSVMSAHSPEGIVYIKIGVSGECFLGSEHAGYMACASSNAVPRTPVVAYAPWIKAKSVPALTEACSVLIRAASEFHPDDHITVLVIRSCAGVTLSEFIQTHSESEVARTISLCAKQIKDMNAHGVYHQDMHCCNIFIPDHGTPHIIDFEYSLVHGTPRAGLSAYDTDLIADNISTFPNERCDLHKFAVDAWVRAGRPPAHNAIFKTVFDIIGWSPAICPPCLRTYNRRCLPWASTNSV